MCFPLTIKSGSLSVTDGGELTTSTFEQGDAGSVTITATDTVSFERVGSNGRSSRVTSQVAPGAFGNGGDINITAKSLSLTDGAELSASSEGNGAAGNIKVAADSISLSNQVVISSDTPAGQGNIELRSGDLVLRRGSNITTNATGTATGGKITIDTGVLAALENSDISANADQAFGGQVRITAQGIFGTEFRQEQTSASDITATGGSPELSGTVEINTPDVDPSLGLVMPEG